MAWLTTLGKILTMDKLRKQHFIVVDWCSMCRKSGESSGSPLLYCEMASSAQWNTIFSLVGLPWVMPNRVVDLLACGNGQCGMFQDAAMWKLVLFCLCGVFDRK